MRDEFDVQVKSFRDWVKRGETKVNAGIDCVKSDMNCESSNVNSTAKWLLRMM